MDQQSQEPLAQVLENYDIKVKIIKIETYKEKKAVWWVETDKGLMVLKKISNSEQTLKYIISAVNHLSKNGIHLAPIVKTKDGSDYAIVDNTCYVLSQAVTGKSPTYNSNKELEMIIKELAKFHRASQGFVVLQDTKPKIHLGTWEDDYTRQVEDMKAFYENEKIKDSPNIIGKFIIEEFPYFYERAYKAIHSFAGEDYLSWVAKAKSKGSLCHQDFAAGNLLLNSSGTLYVLDTDGITIDIPARDLRKILYKVLKKSGKWDVEVVKKILSYYQAENPLTPSEWRVLLLDLTYPHLFLGAMNKYYYQRDKEWSEEKYFKRIKEMAAFEKTIAPLINTFDSIIPR